MWNKKWNKKSEMSKSVKMAKTSILKKRVKMREKKVWVFKKSENSMVR